MKTEESTKVCLDCEMEGGSRNAEHASGLNNSSTEAGRSRKIVPKKASSAVKSRRQSAAQAAQKLKELQYHPTYSTPKGGLFSWDGRTRRSEYFLGMFSLASIQIPLAVLWKICDNNIVLSLLAVPMLVCGYIGFCLQVKRAHDIGWSGVKYWLLSGLCGLCGYICIMIGLGQAAYHDSMESLVETLGRLGGFLISAVMIAAIPSLILLFRNSQKGTNEYGPSPKDSPETAQTTSDVHRAAENSCNSSSCSSEHLTSVTEKEIQPDENNPVLAILMTLPVFLFVVGCIVYVSLFK